MTTTSSNLSGEMMFLHLSSMSVLTALRRCFVPAAAALWMSTTTAAVAGGGPIGIDHEWSYSSDALWQRGNQLGLEYGVVATEVVGALWYGNDTELGHTFFQALDASAISAVAAQGLKYGFGRARPNAGQGPDQWSSGGQSFPSGEVALQASFVTPFIVNYGRKDPWVWSLEALAIYDAVARMKVQAHWQNDVLAGWLLGTATGYIATRWETPLTVQMIPHGLSRRLLQKVLAGDRTID